MATLDQRIAEANRLGMSYGKYMAMVFESNGYKSTPKEEPERENVRHCEICGRELLPGTRATIKTCSGPCSHELDRRRSAAYYRATKGIPDTFTKSCAKCGKEFTTTKGNQVYCSPECQAQRYRYAKKGRKCKNFGEGACMICGDVFEKRAAHQRYCSERCKRQARKTGGA